MSWTATFKMVTTADYQSGGGSPFRTEDSNAHFDESDAHNLHALIDAQHMNAMLHGRQAASQFGHGKYSVKFFLWPRSGYFLDNQNQKNESVAALIKIKSVRPTPLRYAALHHLKSLEKANAAAGPVIEDWDGEANPLLTADLDTANALAPGNAVGSTQSGNKGAKVIRFSFDNQVSVYGQDYHISDLNSDGDVSDNHESKFYNLLVDSTTDFGILPRYEANVNPTVDANGNTVVDFEWDKALSKYKVYGWNEQQAPFHFVHGDDVTTAKPLAYFNNIEALGGLIKVEFTDFTSVSPSFFTADNNDFELYATVTCHSWTPMKRK